MSVGMPACQSYKIDISGIKVLIIISKVSLPRANHRVSPARDSVLKIN
jgi:hypothetical protein